MKRSQEYSLKNGFYEFKNVLYPRTAGFIHLLKKMIESLFKKKFLTSKLDFFLGKYITHIYDVTIAYPKEIVQSEKDMIFKGLVSTNVHYDICKIPITEIPTKTDEDINKWLLK